jgi:hypothetical protein
MGRVLLVVYFFVCGAVAAFIGSFLAGVLATLFILGPLWLFALGPFVGGVGALAGFKLALLPAILFGGLLWCLEIQEKLVWGATGAAVALILQTVTGAMVIVPGWLAITAAFVLAGITAALIFRAIMVALTSLGEPAGRY